MSSLLYLGFSLIGFIIVFGFLFYLAPTVFSEIDDAFYRVFIGAFRGNKQAYYAYFTETTFQMLQTKCAFLKPANASHYFNTFGFVSAKYVRKFVFNKMIELSIPESVADFIQSRVAKRIGARHYMILAKQANTFYIKYLDYITSLRRIFARAAEDNNRGSYFMHEQEADEYASVEVMKESFDNLVKSQLDESADADQLLQALVDAVEGAVTERSLLQVANLALTVQMPVDKLPTLFNCAIKLGFALDQTPEQAVKSLVLGIARKSWQRLDNIGVYVRQPSANQWYEETYGKKPKPAEYPKVWWLYAMHQVEQKGRVLKWTKAARAQIERLKTQIVNNQQKIGELAIPA